MKSTLFAIVSAVALAGVSHADVIISGSVTGFVSSSYSCDANYDACVSNSDQTGSFGGGTLDGTAATFSFSYDATLMALGSSYNDGSGYSYLLDMNGDGFEASLTIGSNNVTISNGGTNQVSSCSYDLDSCGSGNMLGISTYGSSPYNYLSLNSFNLDGSSLPWDVTLASTVNAQLGDPNNSFSVAYYGNADAALPYLSFNISDATYSTASSAPEPATWLTLGVGLAAVLSRRFRRPVQNPVV